MTQSLISADTTRTPNSIEMQLADQGIARMRARLNTILLGKAEAIEHLLASVLARGHVLFDDLPGLGKTTLAKGLAVAIGGSFMRVQCTPDLLPTDITGFNVLNPKTRDFEFRPGPVFSDVLLADEINRATPRTQSALFEAMAERQVTIDGQARPLSSTFLVLATQNPVESLGAYPLPEAQLDRFAVRLRLGYPDRSSELELLNRYASQFEEEAQQPVLEPGQFELLQRVVAQVSVARSLQEYLVSLADVIRKSPDFPLGLSPRGLLQWQRVAQARALLQGRQFVVPDDIKKVAEPVLAIRLSCNQGSVESAIEAVLSAVAVPGPMK